MAVGGWKERYERMSKRLRSASAKAAETAVQARTDIETIGAGAAFGAIRGDFEGNGKRFEIGGDADKGVKGLSPELVVGAPLKLVGYYLGAKPGGSDLNALANGALTAWGFEAARQAMYKRAQGTNPVNTGGPRVMRGDGARRLEAVRQRIRAAEAAKSANAASK